jgi:hypothetical protein
MSCYWDSVDEIILRCPTGDLKLSGGLIITPSPQEKVPLVNVAIEAQIDRCLQDNPRMRRESLTQGAGRSLSCSHRERPEHLISRLTFVLKRRSKLIL